MGCNDTTAMASSGMLFTNWGDLFEQDVKIIPAKSTMTKGIRFIKMVVLKN